MTLSRMMRLTAILLIAALLGNDLAFAAKMPTGNVPVDPGVAKANIAARGVGQEVQVKLADKTKAKGLIVSIGEQSFVLKPKGAEQTREIQYAQVTVVHNQKLSKGQKVGIGVAIFGAGVLIIAAIALHEWDTHPI